MNPNDTSSTPVDEKTASADSDARVHAEIHRRWVQRRNRDTGSPDYREEWYGEQCLHCRFYVPLEGPLGADWGACTNATSPFDRQVMFEHDGCDAFEPAEPR
jgi:hypothetical protein